MDEPMRLFLTELADVLEKYNMTIAAYADHDVSLIEILAPASGTDFDLEHGYVDEDTIRKLLEKRK